MIRWTAATELLGDTYKPRMNRKTAMMEKTIRVKSMEWIMNLLVLMFSRLIPRNPLTKHPTKQIAADPVIIAEIKNNIGSIGLFQKGLAVRAPKRTPV
jgi:hypothetical protein